MELDQLGRVDVSVDAAAAHDQRVDSNRAPDRSLFAHDQETIAVDLAFESAVDSGSSLEKELALVAGFGAEKGVDDGVVVLHRFVRVESAGRRVNPPFAPDLSRIELTLADVRGRL